MLKFLRIETRGGNLVDSQGNSYTRWDDGTFCLDEKNLRERISNVEGAGQDSSAEKEALITMEEVAYHNGDIWANREENS